MSPDSERRAGSLRELRSPELVTLGLLLVYFVWNSLYYFPYIVDDAFISLRYAFNLAAGNGLVYNLGEPVEGFSNFLWVLLEALALWLGLPAVTTMKCVGLLLGVATISITGLLAIRLFAGQAHAGLKCMAAVGFLATNTSLAVWSQSGLETVLLAFLISATCLRFEVEMARSNPFPWSALLFGLAWMTRPEVPIYGLYILGRRWLGRSQRPWSKADLWWLLAAAAVILPYEAWGFWYYGRLLPTTHAAKVGEGGLESMPLRRMLRQPELMEFLTRQGFGLPSLLAGGVAGAFVARRRLPPALWLIPLCGLIFVLYARADWMPRNRFFVPFLPLLSLLIGYGLVELLRALRGRGALFPIAALAVGVVALEYVGAQMFAGEPGGHLESLNKESKMPRRGRGFWFFDVPERLGTRDYPLENSAMFMLRKVPPGETIVLRDIGFPGYLTMNPIWDTAGLVTPTAARARRDRSDEMQQAMFDELLELRPACFRLILPRERRRHINWRIQRWLESDPVARASYERVRPKGELTDDISLVVYLRRDLAPVDFAERLGQAVERLPEYAGRAQEKLDRQPGRRSEGGER